MWNQYHMITVRLVSKSQDVSDNARFVMSHSYGCVTLWHLFHVHSILWVDSSCIFMRFVVSPSVGVYISRRMVSFGMLRRVALVGTNVLEELNSSIIKVTRIGELGMLAVTTN
jgi:hypothetical protein